MVWYTSQFLFKKLNSEGKKPAAQFKEPGEDSSVGYIAFEFAVHVASGFVVEYILFDDVAPALVVEYITFAPIEFVEAALVTLMRSYAMMRLGFMLCVRMSQKRIWRRVWHSRSSRWDASKSERTWRAFFGTFVL